MKTTGSLKKKELDRIPIQTVETKDQFRYLYTTQQFGKILVIDLFKSPDQERPILRAFFDRDEERWITKKADGDWSNATLGYLAPEASYRWWRPEERAKAWRESDAKLIENYFGGKRGTGYDSALEYQNKILKKRLAGKHDKIKLRIDEAMGRVGDLPEDFDDWIDNVVMRPYRYIYYSYRGTKQQQGTCTHCKQDVVVIGAKHNQKGVCPNCQSEVIYKAKKKAAPIHYIEAVSAIVDYDEAGENKKVLRLFSVQRSVQKYGENCCTTVHETHRTVLDEKLRVVREFTFGNFKNTGDIRWCEGGTGGYYASRIYPHNLKEQTAECKQLALAEFAKNSDIKVPLLDYTSTLRNNPEMEYLIKSGLYRIVADTWGGWFTSHGLFNKSAKRLADYLRLDDRGVELCKKYNLGAQGVRFLQYLRGYGTKIGDGDFAMLVRRQEFGSNLAYLISLMSLAKLDRYLETQMRLHNRHYLIGHYADYLRMCEQLGDDIKNDFIKHPRNLITAHDTAVKRLDAEKARKLNEAIKELSTDLNAQYGLHFGGYLVKAPESADELIKEGQTLKHCVASYIDRIVKGETVVLLVRKEKEPDMPFSTMEVCDGRIKQVRGLSNKDMTADLKKLITRFKKEKKVS